MLLENLSEIQCHQIKVLEKKMNLKKISNYLLGRRRDSSFPSKEQELLPLPPVIQQLIDNMVHVDSGIFMMGSNLEEDNQCSTDDEHPASMARPIHQVTLSSFSIGRYEVTQEEWLTVMGRSLSEFKSGKMPVKRVCWWDCQDFIKKLNRLTGMEFRLAYPPKQSGNSRPAVAMKAMVTDIPAVIVWMMWHGIVTIAWMVKQKAQRMVHTK